LFVGSVVREQDATLLVEEDEDRSVKGAGDGEQEFVRGT
jgi:hypothetical protein